MTSHLHASLVMSLLGWQDPRVLSVPLLLPQNPEALTAGLLPGCSGQLDGGHLVCKEFRPPLVYMQEGIAAS